MITYSDIQNYIASVLKNNFKEHTIYLEEVKNLKKPAFFIDLRPISITNYMQYKNKLVNIDIIFLGTKGTHLENLQTQEKLEDIFSLVLEIKDRKLAIENLSTKEVDGVLHCSFTLDYNTEIIKEENCEKMQELILRERW